MRWTFILLLFVQILTGCQRPPMVLATMFEDGTIDPLAGVPEQQRTNQLTLFYATDRVFDPNADLNEQYTRQRSDRLDLGKIDLQFGPDNAWPDIAAALQGDPNGKLYSPAFTRLDRLGQLPQPDPLAPAEREPTKQPSDLFIAELEQALLASGGADITIYIHGFKNSFAEAAYTAAEYDLHTGSFGPFIVYSWPSYDSLFEYSHDRDSVRYTGTHARRLVELLAKAINDGRLSALNIHLVAHSSGAEVVGSVLRELALISSEQTIEQRGKRWRIGSVLMIAPDISTDVARERLLKEDVEGMFDQLVVYSSYHDQALDWAARILYRTPRIGSVREYQLTDADKRWLRQATNVALVDIDSYPYSGIIKHSHHRFSPAVVSDIIHCLRRNLAPEDRGLARDKDQVIWRFADDYKQRATQSARPAYPTPDKP